MKIACKNCNHVYEGKFCNFCGQSADTCNINKKFILHEIKHSIFHLDKGIFFTIKELFIHPGLAIKDFIEGKRVKFYKPIPFVLLLTGIYSFIILYFNIDTTHLSAYESDTKGLPYKMTEWITSHLSLASIILIPISALSSFWAFRNKEYNYAEHIVVNTYLSGLHILIQILFLPIILFIPREHQWTTSSSLGIVTDIIFRFWTFYQIFSSIEPIKRINRILLSCFYYLLLFFAITVTTGIVAYFIYSFL